MNAEHEGHRERLRAKFAENPAALSDLQVLELLLFYAVPRRDTVPVAAALLEKFGSLSRILDADERELSSVAGIGPNSAAMFRSMAEMLSRCLKEQTENMEAAFRQERIVAYAQKAFSAFDRSVESLLLVSLDASFRPVSHVLLGRGGASSVSVDFTQVKRALEQERPAAFVLVHNHPSGIGLPSVADYGATDRFAEKLNALGVPLYDHLILDGNGDALSFLNSGFLDCDGMRPSYTVRKEV